METVFAIFRLQYQILQNLDCQLLYLGQEFIMI